MSPALLAASAATAAMPGDVDLADVDRWVEHAADLVVGPEGCREWTGRATWAWDLGRYGAARGEAVVAGRTEDGRWGTMLLWPRGEVRRPGDPPPDGVLDLGSARVVPFVGDVRTAVSRLADGGAAVGLQRNASATGAVRGALSALATPGPGDWVEWDESRGAVVLHRSLPLGRGAAEAVVWFPDGGEAPGALTLSLPRTRPASPFGPRLRSARLSIAATEGGGVTETLEVRMAAGSGGGEQTVSWRPPAACPPQPSASDG